MRELIGAAVVLGLAAAAIGDDFAPHPSEARLRRGTFELAPAEVAAAARASFVADGLRIETDRGSVRAVRVADGREAWSIQIPNGDEVRWLARDAGVLHAAIVHAAAGAPGDGRIVVVLGEVQRLSTATGKWLAPLVFGDKTQGTPWRIAAAEGAVAVLDLAPDSPPTRVRVSYFAPEAVKPTWTKTLAFAPETLAGPAARGVEPVCLAGGHVIVCPAARGDVTAFERRDGAVAWKLERAWEYARASSGYDVQMTQSRPSPDRRIVGGPVAVKYRGTGGEWDAEVRDSYRLFVATAKPLGDSTSRLTDGSLHEINDRGHVIAATPTPRVVLGAAALPKVVLGPVARPLGDGVLWRFEGGALAKVAPSEQRPDPAYGMGTDRVVRLAWWREPEAPRVPRGFLTTGVDPAPFASDGREAWLVAAGGYVREKDVRLFELPLTRVDLDTGAEAQFVLTVPYAGDPPVPGSDGEPWPDRAIRSPDPLGLSVGALDLDAAGLVVRLDGNSGPLASLRFDAALLR